MRLEEAIKDIAIGKFRVIKRIGTACEDNNYSITLEYDNIHKAIQEARRRNDEASEAGRSMYFYVADDEGNIIFPDE